MASVGSVQVEVCIAVDSDLTALAAKWKRQATVKMECADRIETSPQGARQLRHAATCELNCATELEAVIAKRNSPDEGIVWLDLEGGESKVINNGDEPK